MARKSVERNATRQPRERLLFVDDETEILEVLQEYFQGRYDTETAADGKAAIERIKRHKPDVVLLDIMMPGMDGLEVLKLMNQSSEKIPVIMLTANPNNARAVEALQNGVFSYAPKPLDLPYLDHLVSIALDQRRRRATDPRAGTP